VIFEIDVTNVRKLGDIISDKRHRLVSSWFLMQFNDFNAADKGFVNVLYNVKSHLSISRTKQRAMTRCDSTWSNLRAYTRKEDMAARIHYVWSITERKEHTNNNVTQSKLCIHSLWNSKTITRIVLYENAILTIFTYNTRISRLPEFQDCP